MWAEDAEHARRARADFDLHPSRRYWQVDDEAADTGGACTIPPVDPEAVAQRNDYGWAWAIYAVGVLAGQEDRHAGG